MGARSRSVWIAVACAAALTARASVTDAQTAVLASPPASSEVRELRVAVADGLEQSTTWVSARVQGAADEVSLVIPVAPESAVDLSSDAWFEALEEVTNTRVLPPSEAPDATCAAAQLPGSGDHDLVGDAAHVATVAPLLPGEILSFSQLVVWLQGQDLDLPFDAMTAYANLDTAGYRFLLLRHDVPSGESTLATVRTVSSPGSATVPLLVSRAGAAAATLRVWTFASGPAAPGQLASGRIDPATVLWDLSGFQPPTNYRDVLAEGFDGGEAWVVDAASHASIFRATPVPGGVPPIPSLVEAYFERASGFGDAQADPTACIARVASLESSPSTVGRVCAAGAVSVLGAGCVESPQAGEILPDDLRCGGVADDLALALSGAQPSERWLSRWTGSLPAWTARGEESIGSTNEDARSSIVECGGWDTSVCESDAGTAGAGGSAGTGGTGGSTAPPNTGGSGYGGGSTAPNPGSQDPYDSYDDDDTYVYVEGSCWGDTSTTTTADDTEDDSCSGDSSSGSTGDEETCSGDTSSTADEDETACAGDSSDSADGEDACSGDTSDTAEGDDACSGDTSDTSSSSSDSCSGDSTSGGSSSADSCSGDSGSSSSSSDCTVTSKRRSGRGRLPTSAFALLLAASAFAARRLRKDDEGRSPFR